MSKDPTKAVTHSEEQGNWPAESSSKKEPAAEREPCVKYFDALWFCYSPVHQLQQYYQFGQADDCLGHWSTLYACLKKRTKFAHQVPEDPMNGKHPLWRLRSKEEAAAFWEKEFGQPQPGRDGDDMAAPGSSDFGQPAGERTVI